MWNKRLYLFRIKLFGYTTLFTFDFGCFFELFYISLQGNQQRRKMIQISILDIEAIKSDETANEEYIWNWSLFDGKKVFIDERIKWEFYKENKVRDPKRIDRMVELIRMAWKLYPDLRLGQLISIIG